MRHTGITRRVRVGWLVLGIAGGRRRSRAVPLALAVTMGMAGVVAVPGSVPWRDAAEPDPGPVALPWNEPASAPAATQVPGRPGTARFPAPGIWNLVLGGKGEIATTADLPVSLSVGIDGMSGERLKVQVLDHDLAERVGASGFVFRVAEVPEADGLPAEITVNYKDIAQAYGADYYLRLRVRALDDCVLVDPLPRGCSITGPELPVHNDVEDLATLANKGTDATSSDGAGAVFAVTSAAGGDTGTFAATPLSIAWSWQLADPPPLTVVSGRSIRPTPTPSPHGVRTPRIAADH